MNEKFFNVMKSAVEAYFDTLVECGGEYREIYDKQSDFAKAFFLGATAIHFSKEEYLRIFSMAEEVEKIYNEKHRETN